MTKQEIQENINLLVSWAESKGYTVHFEKSGIDNINSENKTIEINATDKKCIQLVSLLHECGHLLVYQYDPRKICKKSEDHSERSLKRKTYTIIEEVEAWNRAEFLKKRFKMNIDPDFWEKQKILALTSYVKWAGGK